MKKRAILAMLVLSVFGLTACDEEDPTDIVDEQDELVGTWVSAGDDVAPGLAQFFAIDSIIATFEEDQTYTVLQFAGGSDQPGTLAGTYVLGNEAEGEIRSITLDQNVGGDLVAQGIFRVTGSQMRYEVIQVEPDIGATPPTVEGGFGSTVVGGQTTNLWIQDYDRVADIQ